MTKALFLDRDGILNIDKTYVYRYEDIEWVPGIFELISFANTNDFLVIVLTNQSGVARGKYLEEDIKILHQKMSQFLLDKKLRIDDWYYCCEFESERRKPRPGMMLEAQRKYDINLSMSFMVGDKPTDILEIEGPLIPKTLLLKGNYPLDGVKAEIFENLFDIRSRIETLSK